MHLLEKLICYLFFVKSTRQKTALTPKKTMSAYLYLLSYKFPMKFGKPSIITLNSCKNLMPLILLIPFQSWENWGPEKSHNMPNVTELTNDKNSISTQAHLLSSKWILRSLCFLNKNENHTLPHLTFLKKLLLR